MGVAKWGIPVDNFFVRLIVSAVIYKLIIVTLNDALVVLATSNLMIPNGHRPRPVRVPTSSSH